MAIKEIKPSGKLGTSSKPPEAAVPPAHPPETRDAILDGFESNQSKSETEAPDEEARSHKPTFGEAAEKPEKTEPEGDPTIEPEAPTAMETLDKRVEAQANQLNPDQVQEDGHWPSTESLLSAPKTRPHMIDGATGHIVYKGDVAQLPGGNIDAEGMAED